MKNFKFEWIHFWRKVMKEDWLYKFHRTDEERSREGEKMKWEWERGMSYIICAGFAANHNVNFMLTIM